MINWISWTYKSRSLASHVDLALSTFNHKTDPVNICQQYAVHINLHTDILWHTKDIATHSICSETFRYAVVPKCTLLQVTWHPHTSKIRWWMCVHVLEWDIKYMKYCPCKCLSHMLKSFWNTLHIMESSYQRHEHWGDFQDWKMAKHRWRTPR